MKKKQMFLLCFGLLFAGLAYSFHHSKRTIAAESSKWTIAAEPWTPAQLESPEDLAKIINDPKAKQPIIFCIGPGAVIKGSIDIGPARDSLNLAKLKQQLIHLSKDADIIIYCGCCPFEHCPNIRPAFTLLNQMAFTRQKLLNIEHNVKIDWINKGYPVTQ
jgi:thiosulfate/3-mercaptopyruvate sulfurtransferase